MKNIAKRFLTKILGWQVIRLQRKTEVKVVAVAGSVGKTTTKHVIANYLGASKRVLYQQGNYNVPLTVPLIFFDEELPILFNFWAWAKLLYRNEQKLKDFYPYDVVVVEVGIDAVGEMDQFAKYLNADVGVLTSIAPEHMEFFTDLDEVAKEELKLKKFCKIIIAGTDDIPETYKEGVAGAVSYGIGAECDYRMIGKGSNITIITPADKVQYTTRFVGKHVQKSFAAALAVADALGIKNPKSGEVLGDIQPMPGRMQLLDGKNGSIIIDDSYNNVSQVPLMAALDVLYAWPAAKRIAVLGNMNELGKFSKGAHEQVGAYCDPKKLELVITIGPDSNKYLAKAAQKAGCNVLSFDSPYKIGEYLKETLNTNTVVLVKGSQNKVYLEEAIRPVLKNISDRSKLVRQSQAWITKKQKQFS